MFGKRFNFLTFAGIKIGIDLSWFFIAILLSWTLAIGYFPHFYPGLSGASYWLMGILGMLGLFACVVLHELGHAITAKHFKLSISQITLFIFGGVAEIRDEAKSPKAEFFVAIAGPIVSVFLAICMYLLAMVGKQFAWPILFIGVMHYLAVINLVIVIFNLIPAFPLDGGRVLRAILWGWKKDFSWATKISARLGSGFGFLLIFLGILSFITGNFLAGFWWMILGLFLHKAATSSRTQFFIRQELDGEKVLKFMSKHPLVVSPDLTLKKFVEEHVYKSYHHLYPVVQGEKLLGYISLREVKSLPAEEWASTPIKKVMVPITEFQTVSPKSSALEALSLMHQIEMPTLLVVENGHLVGILTPQDLFKLISLKLELEGEERAM